MERVRMETLGNRRLLVTDLSDLGPDEARLVLQQTHLELSRLPRERTVLSLAIVRNLRMDATVTEEMKRVMKLNSPWVVAGAIVGVSTIGRVIGRGMAMVTGRGFNAFGSEEEAKAFLLKAGAPAA
ncbi:MAG: hypothetical protein E6J61_14505 [Deltaproteobacteria bacterium]|nr:MAG: hypothetical protein E6J61_14505 [Deltaproteobacteria bacterium]